VISTGWILPPSTRIIGVGNGDVVTSGGTLSSGTIIQACKALQSGCTTFPSGGTMISMCSTTCSGVSIENLSLDGQGQAINGILNGFAASLAAGLGASYVRNVNLFQIVGTGLSVTTNALGSGPYTKLPSIVTPR
jgi:hypothetical protein